MNADVRSELEEALRLHREGQNDEAEGVCGRVMAAGRLRQDRQYGMIGRWR